MQPPLTTPNPSSRCHWALVFAGGLGWAVLFTAVVTWLGLDGDSWLRYYLREVPLGAIVSGAIAAFGYCFISRTAGVRMPLRMTVLACLTCPAAYAAQEYGSFLLALRAGTATPGGFWPWLSSLEIRSIYSLIWDQLASVGGMTSHGTGWRVLECAGYLTGGLAAIISHACLPWCTRCGWEMSVPLVRDWYPAVRMKTAKKGSREEKLRAIADVREEAERVAEAELEAVHRLSPAEVLARISRYAPPPPADPVTFLATVRVTLNTCPCCGAQRLKVRSYLPDARLSMGRIRHRWTKTRTANSFRDQASPAMPAMA